MAGVCVFAEITDQGVSETYLPLVAFGKSITDVSGESLTALAACDGAEKYGDALQAEGVDEIILAEVPGASPVQTDILAEAVASVIREKDFSTILVPATHLSRSLFARVAMKENIGMTADCTSLRPEKTSDGVVVHQIKPSFGAQIMVRCDVTGGREIITMKTEDCEPAAAGGSAPVTAAAPNVGASAIEVKGFEPVDTAESIHDAEVVVCAGRGAMEDDNFEKIKAFAAKIDASVAGSRPMADNGWIPFENQVGQSGTVIRPKVCFTFGVSGAIQFTEGIKGDPMVIAVNKDPYAAIFGFADYAVVSDMSGVLDALLK
jgi:electron transfer flavoprotein alpha subunit